MSKKVRDELDRFLESGINLTSRTIYIGSLLFDDEGTGSGVDEAMAEHVIKAVLSMEVLNQDAPITLILNNAGGDVVQALAIYDVLNLCKCPIIAKVYGMAYSAASLILQAAHIRLLAPNASVMIHFGTEGYSPDHVKVVRNWVEFNKEQEKIMENIYLQRVKDKGIDKAKLKRLLQFDTIFTAARAIEHGLADGILDSNLDMEV